MDELVSKEKKKQIKNNNFLFFLISKILVVKKYLKNTNFKTLSLLYAVMTFIIFKIS